MVDVEGRLIVRDCFRGGGVDKIVFNPPVPWVSIYRTRGNFLLMYEAAREHVGHSASTIRCTTALGRQYLNIIPWLFGACKDTKLVCLTGGESTCCIAGRAR